MTDSKNLLKQKLKSKISTRPASAGSAEAPTSSARVQEAAKPQAATKSRSKKSTAPQAGAELQAAAKIKTTAKAKTKTKSQPQIPPAATYSDGASVTRDIEQLISEKKQAVLAKAEATSGVTQDSSLAAPGAAHSKPRKRVRGLKPKVSFSVADVWARLSDERKQALQRMGMLYALALVIVILDQVTKSLAYSELLDGSVRLTSWFDLILVLNPGAAFSLLADSGWQRPFLVAVSAIVSAVLVVWITRLPSYKIVLPLALACVLGGAIGNLIDRALYGHVIDFISLHYQALRFPTFNLADAMISVGAVLLIVDMILGKEPSQADATAVVEPPLVTPPKPETAALGQGDFDLSSLDNDKWQQQTGTTDKHS